MNPSKSALKEKIITIRRGLAIYQINGSPFWYARIRLPNGGKNIVRSTKETSRLEARKVAEELYLSLLNSKGISTAPQEFRFGYFADELVKAEKLKGERGELHERLWKSTDFYLQHKAWGVCLKFDKEDVRTISTVSYNRYMDWVRSKDNTLKPATMNHITDTISKVLKLARDRGAIESVPDLPRTSRKDNPRPFFRFHPLVPKEEDEYKKLLDTAKDMASEGVKVR